MQLAQRWLLVAGALFLAAAGSVVVRAQDNQAKTVWDGVYTEAQAARATTVFGSTCANCHTLESSGGRRPLSGDAFWEGYTLRTVGDLLTYVSKNMPNGVNAGTLPAATYNDLVALVLKSNGFPAGTTELTPESAATVQIVKKDGSSELPAGTLARVVGCLSKGGSDWVLTSATVPERVEKAGVGAEDATRPLGTGTTPLKFVLTRLDKFVGQRVSASGLLIGPGGTEGLNVTTVNGVAAACP